MPPRKRRDPDKILGLRLGFKKVLVMRLGYDLTDTPADPYPILYSDDAGRLHLSEAEWQTLGRPTMIAVVLTPIEDE